MKAERGEQAAEEKFETSRDWFTRFQERTFSKEVQEAASAAVEAPGSYPEALTKIIIASDYSKQLIFIVDKTASSWKKIPSRTFIAREKSLAGLKASKAKLTLLLGAIAAGEIKPKPVLIYVYKNPRACKNDAKSTLPVLCKWNNKAWMIAHLFITWLTEHFKHIVETCSEKKIPFKILLLIDNVPSHSRLLIDMYEIDVAFIPTEATSHL